MRRHNCGFSFLARALLVVLVVILVGYVCVLPDHGHVEAATQHSDGDQPYDSDETVHAASCEMLRSSWVTCSAILIPSAFAVADSDQRSGWARPLQSVFVFCDITTAISASRLAPDLVLPAPA